MKSVDADEVLRKAVAIAAREIDRLAALAASPKPDGSARGLQGWESADLERYAGIVQRANDHELKWLAKLDPAALPEHLVQRVLAATEEGEADGAQRKRKPRTGA